MATEEFGNNNHVKLTELQLVESEFGHPLEECYKKAIKFYKGKLIYIHNIFRISDKERAGELTISYDDRVKLMALAKQVCFLDNALVYYFVG